MAKNDLKILAIDDNPDDLAVLKAAISGAFPGATVFTALRGVNGIELALVKDPDVVLLDIAMAGMDGFEVCRKFKENERLRHIPIVILTDLKTDRESRIKSLEAGAEAFLSKPIDEFELTAQVRAMVKIRAAKRFEGMEKERLAILVAERTKELERGLAERNQVETALRESEERFRLHFENAPLPSQSLDSDGNIIAVNNAWLKSLGYSREEVIGQWFGDFLPADHQDIFRERFPRFKKMGEIFGAEFEMVHKDGSFRIVSFDGRIGLKPDGSFRQTYCVFKDLTSIRQTEEALREKEKDYRLLVENLSSGVVVHAPDTRIIFSNPMASTLLGLTEDQMRGKAAIDPDWCFLREDKTPMPLAEYPVNRVLSSGAPFSGQVLGIRRPDLAGSVWVLCNAYPVNDAGGHLSQVVVTFFDITRRKRVEEALEKRLVALTRPLDDSKGITFEELFNLDDIQRLQDEFARATGVASIITRTDGTPITAPSNFCRLCSEIIRKTDKGLANCYRSDAIIGHYSDHGPTIQPCMSGGLWDAGAGISVGGQHIANWLIGQVRDETQTEEKMRDYARKIGADEAETVAAFREIPVMSRDRFGQVSQALFTLANQLSAGAYQNIQQARFIADRKEAVELLRESEDRLARVLEGSQMGYWDWNIETGEVKRNERWAGMLGYTLREIEFNVRQWTDLQHPDDRAAAWKSIQDHLEGRTDMHKIEYRMRAKDGQYKWILDCAKVVRRDAQGRPLRMSGTHTDISDRKKTEEKLKEANEMFSLFMRYSPIYTFIKEVSPAQSIVLQASDNFQEMIGMTGREIVGKNMAELFPPEFAAKITADDWAVASNGEALKLDEELNGRSYTTVKFPLARGDKNLLAGYTIDITERKRAEEEREKMQVQLNQALKMESVGRLAGGVAHDFNNMLGIILGHTEMAMDQVDPVQPLYDDLTEIRKAAERSANLTRQLLAFARKQTVAPMVLDLNETVESMLKMLRRLIGEDIDLVWLPGAGMWPVKVDPTQIDQILANLCLNARDAIPGVGRVTIETENVVFDEAYCVDNAEAAPGEYVSIAVSDDGSGMGKEILDKLFEPFFTTKEMGKGTGLGLATVYGIVKQNNGFIKVYSEPGVGTTFRIYLPRHQGKSGQMQQEFAAEPAATGHETILLVEDEPAILKMTTKMLERLGYSVLAANTPGAAIRLAEAHPAVIHLLMTDVVMPEMNGRDLAKNLLSLYPHLKRLFMSGYTANVIAHHGVLDEGVHFIQKPFTMKDLADMLRSVLDSK